MKLNKNTVGVEAVNKALEILNCFTERDETLSVTKISNITGRINLNFGDSHLGSSINAREQNKNSIEVDVHNLEDFFFL